MEATYTMDRRYRRLLILATVSPILLAVLAYRLGVGPVWPWAAALPVAAGAWVMRDAARRGEPFRRLWTALAVLPVALWLVFLAFWLLLPA